MTPIDAVREIVAIYARYPNTLVSLIELAVTAVGLLLLLRRIVRNARPSSGDGGFWRTVWIARWAADQRLREHDRAERREWFDHHPDVDPYPADGSDPYPATPATPAVTRPPEGRP
jgi:hypothetical protein